jgi:hypothetical protein
MSAQSLHAQVSNAMTVAVNQENERPSVVLSFGLAELRPPKAAVKMGAHGIRPSESALRKPHSTPINREQAFNIELNIRKKKETLNVQRSTFNF